MQAYSKELPQRKVTFDITGGPIEGEVSINIDVWADFLAATARSGLDLSDGISKALQLLSSTKGANNG